MSGAYDVLFLPGFLSNRLQTLALGSLGIEVYCYIFGGISSSSGFIQDFLNRYTCMDRCRVNDVYVGCSLIHCMGRLKCGQ